VIKLKNETYVIVYIYISVEVFLFLIKVVLALMIFKKFVSKLPYLTQPK